MTRDDAPKSEERGRPVFDPDRYDFRCQTDDDRLEEPGPPNPFAARKSRRRVNVRAAGARALDPE